MGEVRAHELIIASVTGAVFGVLGYFVTRKIEAPIRRAVDRATGS